MVQCYCGSGTSFSECCQPLIEGKVHAESPEALLRSRYSAFVVENISYIGDTVHPAMKHEFDENGIREWSTNSKWLGLEIVKTEGGAIDDEKGTVHFIAKYENNGKGLEHNEVAEFRKKNDRWYFYDGKFVGQETVVRDAPKVGRNDPCPCGSGKKYKKCCGK